jgi:SAM-dependent methyltransferase
MATILRPAVCTFLAYLERVATTHLTKTVLECGAGGRYPPLAFFYEKGYDSYGIDISEKRINLATVFCREHTLSLSLIKGDMRDIPFGGNVFSFVYECDSLCRLTKKDSRTTIREMARVLKKGGYLSVGFLTVDNWPLTGEEKNPGEFWSYLGREVVHSYYRDDELDQYFTGLDVVLKEKRVVLYDDMVAHLSKENWTEWYDHTWTRYSRTEWMSLYDERLSRFCRSSIQYIARKPGIE